ncbi:hypothetical protein D3C78_1929310 [compost metagenome]
MGSEQRGGAQFLQHHDIVRDKTVPPADQRMRRFAFADPGLAAKQDADPRYVHAHSVD